MAFTSRESLERNGGGGSCGPPFLCAERLRLEILRLSEVGLAGESVRSSDSRNLQLRDSAHLSEKTSATASQSQLIIILKFLLTHVFNYSNFSPSVDNQSHLKARAPYKKRIARAQGADSSPMKTVFRGIIAIATFVLLPCLALVTWAGVGGSISGSVKDSTGAAVPQAAVTATNTSTGEIGRAHV